jgi:hypothetical protein
MNQGKAFRWTRAAVWGGLAAVLSIGCNPLNIAAFIFAREDKVPAQYPLTFDKDGPKKDREEVVVAVLPQVAPERGPRFATTANELADRLARHLPEMAKENKDKRKVKVLSQAQVDKFKMAHPDWKRMGAGEVGQKLGADFVLEVWVDKLQLYQPGTRDEVYEGRAEVFVSVYEVGSDGGTLKDKYPLSSQYPRTGVRPRDAMSESAFKSQLIETIATDIAKMHVDHKPSNSIADGR